MNQDREAAAVGLEGPRERFSVSGPSLFEKLESGGGGLHGAASLMIQPERRIPPRLQT
jgi:hypothetical protein